MIDFFRRLLRLKPSVNVGELIANGAVIIDVRSKAEYQAGHLKQAINMPLDTLAENLARLDKARPVVTCCASGMRSGSAKSILQAHGFERVHNAGPWTSLRAFEE